MPELSISPQQDFFSCFLIYLQIKYSSSGYVLQDSQEYREWQTKGLELLKWLYNLRVANHWDFTV